VVKKYGNDALFLPPVDFGHGPKIGGGSWEWGISINCSPQQAQGAAQFINSLLQPQQLALIESATGLVPVSPAAAALVPSYASGGAYRTFFDLSQRFTIMRPPTPAYLTISTQFEKAGEAIAAGGNVQNALDNAVDAIDRDIQDHNNYQ
jgi:multiple sugar transport system substrate-binding protein